MSNYHDPWTVETHFRASEMEPRVQSLDDVISYHKTPIVTCDGNIDWDSSTGVLTWDAPITIYFNTGDGNGVKNTIAAGTDTIPAGHMLNVTLNPATDTVLTTTTASITTGSASNYLAKELLVLAHRNSVNDSLTLVNWCPTKAVAGTEPFDIYTYYPSTPPAGVLHVRVPLARALTFPANFAGSVGKSATPANAEAVFDIKKTDSGDSTTTVGTMTFAAASKTATFASTGGIAVPFAQGDIISVVAPSPADSTLADIGIVITGIR